MDIQESKEQLLLLALARQQHRLNLGRLMSPEEVLRATRDRKSRPPQLSGWFVCTELHPQMFALLARHGIDGQTTRRVTLNGHQFLVLVQQTCHWQHRLVLALQGSRLQRCLGECRQQSLRLALCNHGTAQALVLECSAALRAGLPGADAISGEGHASTGFLYELAGVVQQLLSAPAVQIAGLESVRAVCVSVVRTGARHCGREGASQAQQRQPFEDLRQ